MRHQDPELLADPAELGLTARERESRGVFKSKEKRDPRLIDMIGPAADSWSRPSRAGMRGPAPARSLCLSAGAFDLHVRLTDDGEGVEIRGQLMKTDGLTFAGGSEVLLVGDGGRVVATTAANEFGEFSFEKTKSRDDLAIGVSVENGRRIYFQLPKGNPK